MKEKLHIVDIMGAATFSLNADANLKIKHQNNVPRHYRIKTIPLTFFFNQGMEARNKPNIHCNAQQQEIFSHNKYVLKMPV